MRQATAEACGPEHSGKVLLRGLQLAFQVFLFHLSHVPLYAVKFQPRDLRFTSPAPLWERVSFAFMGELAPSTMSGPWAMPLRVC